MSVAVPSEVIIEPCRMAGAVARLASCQSHALGIARRVGHRIVQERRS
jgi:hypothetical protein